MNNSSETGETMTEFLTFGAILVLFIFTMFGPITWAFFSLLTAAILLGSAYYQRSQGWEVSIWTWFFGIVFGLATVLQIVATVLKWAFGMLWNTLIPLLVIGIGLWFLWNILFKDRESK
jgi:hypothetical protein